MFGGQQFQQSNKLYFFYYNYLIYKELYNILKLIFVLKALELVGTEKSGSNKTTEKSNKVQHVYIIQLSNNQMFMLGVGLLELYPTKIPPNNIGVNSP